MQMEEPVVICIHCGIVNSVEVLSVAKVYWCEDDTYTEDGINEPCDVVDYADNIEGYEYRCPDCGESTDDPDQLFMVVERESAGEIVEAIQSGMTLPLARRIARG